MIQELKLKLNNYKGKYMKTIYLCVKQHNKTGLKYFCKTTRKNPVAYSGSGVKWKEHLNEHGWDFNTIEIWEFNDQNECIKFAIDFSKTNNIVESVEWANLKIENGRDGGGNLGIKLPPRSAEHIERHRQSIIGRPNPGVSAARTGSKQSDESNHKRSIALTGRPKPPRSKLHNLNISIAKKGVPMPTLRCPHCNKIGGAPQMKQWHFNNCKTLK